MRVILVANTKGGCGKTTMSTTLASALAASGRRVAIADADPQRSSLTWLARRPAEAPPIHAIDSAPTPPRLGDPERRSARLMRKSSWWREVWRDARAEARRKRIEWLIIDAPAGEMALSGGLRALISKVDLVVAPVAPSVYDEHATRRFLALLEGAPAFRDGDADLIVVANRIRRKRRLEGRLADAVGRFFARIGFEPTAEIREGAAYPALAADGLGLFDPQVDAIASRKTAQLRADWRPLLGALGLEKGSASA